MKRLITLLLAMILCLSLEACDVKAELVPNPQEIHIQVTPQEKTEEAQTESSNTIAPEEATETMEETTEMMKETTETINKNTETTEIATGTTKKATEATKKATETAKKATETTKKATETTEKATETTKKATETTEKATDTMEEPIQLNYDLIGPWHLNPSKNDLAAFADSLGLFPGYGEWGASMEISGNGEMSWYIGAESWHGTYSVEKNTLHAHLTSDLEQTSKVWDFRITSENGTYGLEMAYKNMTIYWVYGDQAEAATGNTVPSNWEKATEDEPWKVALAEDLFAKYGVIPKYYEDLGDGIFQVYVEIGGEIVPFVAVNSATGDYHG